LIWGRETLVLDEIANQHSNHKYLPGVSLPSNLIACDNIAQLLQQAEDLLIAVPSKAFCAMLNLLKPYITPKHRIVWATKGLEPESGRFLHNVVLDDFGPDQKYAILSGPSFATEVARQLPTAVTIATANEDFAKDLLNYFHGDNFRVYLSTDIIGVQVGGVVKNILAVAAGLSDGLGFGANARAALITRGIAEMMRFGLTLGARAETLQGLAGIGDIILTCTDNQSRNRRFGLALAQGKDIDTAQAEIGQVVEAPSNTAEICRIASAHNIEMPIAEQLLQVLLQQITPQQAAYNLISRKPANE